MGRKIQDYNFWYAVLRYYVDFVLKLSYRTIRYVGREKIPQDGAVIYAPNHTNALMDALVILAMDRKAKVFVARADIFKKPLLAKIFTFLKIMPIMRMRDGMDEVRKNNETIQKAVDVLRDKVPFCIFPEGQHQTKYCSLPLSKGIFRIAFQAQELMPDVPLYIVPVGIRYGHFFRFRSTVRVQVGDPIDVRDFLAEYSGATSQEQMNIVKDILARRMRASIFYIPDDENYDATFEICVATVKLQVKQLMHQSNGQKMHELDAHFVANNQIVGYIEGLKSREPAKAERLLALGAETFKLRKAKRVNIESVSVKYPVLSRVLKSLYVVVTLPYCILVSILTLPIKILLWFLLSKFKDAAFHNSVRYLVNLVLWPVLMIIYSIIAYAMLTWQWALPLTLLLLPAPIVAHEAWRLMRLAISDVRYIFSKELRRKHAEIREIIFNDK